MATLTLKQLIAPSSALKKQVQKVLAQPAPKKVAQAPVPAKMAAPAPTLAQLAMPLRQRVPAVRAIQPSAVKKPAPVSAPPQSTIMVQDTMPPAFSPYENAPQPVPAFAMQKPNVIPQAMAQSVIVSKPPAYDNGAPDEILEYDYASDDGWGEQHQSLEDEISEAELEMAASFQFQDPTIDELSYENYEFINDEFYNNSSNPKEIAGFSLKPPKALRKAVSSVTKKAGSVAKAATGNIATLAKTMGPVVAIAVPGAGPALAAATALTAAVKSGDPRAIANVSKIAADAAKNIPEAKQALDALDAVKNIERNVMATDLLKAAKAGDPEALKKIAAIKSSNDPNAKEAAAAIDAAAIGVLQAKAADGERPKYLRGTIEMHFVPEPVARLD